MRSFAKKIVITLVVLIAVGAIVSGLVIGLSRNKSSKTSTPTPDHTIEPDNATASDYDKYGIYLIGSMNDWKWTSGEYKFVKEESDSPIVSCVYTQSTTLENGAEFRFLFPFYGFCNMYFQDVVCLSESKSVFMECVHLERFYDSANFEVFRVLEPGTYKFYIVFEKNNSTYFFYEKV